VHRHEERPNGLNLGGEARDEQLGLHVELLLVQSDCYGAEGCAGRAADENVDSFPIGAEVPSTYP
jgi:hypothetical protein